MESFAADLLDHNRNVDDAVHLSVDAREAIRRFRENYTNILASSHTMTVTFAYATKSDQAANPKVLQRVQFLKKYVNSQLSHAEVVFDFWGAEKLLTEARRGAKTQETIAINERFQASDTSTVCLVKLSSLAGLLRDKHGELRRTILEANVRDYQGLDNKVNKAIRETLEKPASPEFWWLSNGITILAETCAVVGHTVVMSKPEIVNGLQTSYEIFQFFRDAPDKKDDRNVLIRIIVPPNEQVRSKIIRATNFQTPISDINLHATDQIHFDIEEKLRLYQLFYERRKGEYREAKEPVDKIISIQTLARAVIAILLQQPNNAYATPTRVLKNQESYKKIFDETYNRDLYVVCILIQRQVDKHLLAKGVGLKDTRSFAKYYVSMMVACELLKTIHPNAKMLPNLLPIVVKPISAEMMDDCINAFLSFYNELGATETVAKGPDLREKLLKKMAEKYSGGTLL
jgi:hypothetical protein